MRGRLLFLFLVLVDSTSRADDVSITEDEALTAARTHIEEALKSPASVAAPTDDPSILNPVIDRLKGFIAGRPKKHLDACYSRGEPDHDTEETTP